MAMGMSLNIGKFFETPLTILSLVMLLVVVKVAVLWPLAQSFRLDNNKSLATALLLGQSGEFALVLFSLAFQAQIFTSNEFDTLLLVVLISMLITPILAVFAERLNKASTKNRQHKVELPSSPIVIAGYGRVGRRIGEVLTIANLPYIAIDSNANQVKNYQRQGHNVVFGDVTQPEILNSVGIKNAELIIVTVNEAEAAKSVVEVLHNNHPELKVYARGHNGTICHELKQLGAFGVVSENLEASLELSRMVLNHEGFTYEERQDLLTDFRDNYYEQVNQGPVK